VPTTAHARRDPSRAFGSAASSSTPRLRAVGSLWTSEGHDRINRESYLPEISGRSFPELSSEGLKTLVNIAHALAHHTFAIDADLPLPGLLVLDGISSNAGSEGYDRAQVLDAYHLLEAETEKYAGALQGIAVDNTIPSEVLLSSKGVVALTLTHTDRLIRLPQSQDASSAVGPNQ
jgi:hypothetical protein